MGGEGTGRKVKDSCEAYDILKDEWSNVQSMLVKKSAFSATVVNNKYIYTFGGYGGGSLDLIERYNIAENRW